MAERKTYTDAQKAEILKKAEETSIAAAAKEFGVNRLTITKWKAAADVTADKIEAKKTVRAAGRKVKADAAAKKEKAAEKKAEKKEVKEAVASVADDKRVAVEIETKKKTRGAARKVKEAVTDTAEKVATDVKGVAEKVKTVEEIEAGKVKATRTRKAAEKQAAKEEKAAEKAAKKENKAANKPSVKVKTVKLNMIFQSTMGGAITPEQIALKVPKEATDVYVKLEENKIYWVGKDGDTGSIEIW